MRRWTKQSSVFVCLVIMMVVIGVTLASHNNRGSVENVMATRGSSVQMQELFDPADYWLPGESKQKELKFRNEGERAQVIRFRIQTQWFHDSGGKLDPVTEKPAWIKWTSAIKEKWTKFADDDGWYYYNKILPANTETDKVMEAVTFSTKLSNDNYVENFSNVKHQIVVQMEALDVNPTITEVKWGKTFVGDEEIKWAN